MHEAQETRTGTSPTENVREWLEHDHELAMAKLIMIMTGPGTAHARCACDTLNNGNKRKKTERKRKGMRKGPDAMVESATAPAQPQLCRIRPADSDESWPG